MSNKPLVTDGEEKAYFGTISADGIVTLPPPSSEQAALFKHLEELRRRLYEQMGISLSENDDRE